MAEVRIPKKRGIDMVGKEPPEGNYPGVAPDIIILHPDDRKYRLKVPRAQIKCKDGNARMQCGSCGFYDFGVHVSPSKGLFAGTAKVAEVICLNCGRFYKTDDHGNLGGGYFNRRQVNDSR